MDFKDLQVKEIRGVLRYKPTITRWVAKERVDHIIGIQLCGKAVHSFPFGNFTIQENTIYFLNQKDIYTVNVIDPCEAFSFHFTTWDDIETNSFCIQAVNPGSFLTILQKAEIAKAMNHNLELHSLLYRFCAELDRNREKTYSPKDYRILKAKEYIDLHYREQDCLANAVVQSQMSARHFGALFRTAYDCTPNRYIISKKIAYAKILLTMENLSVTDVASLCNFSDVYYFSKVFKSETGISPSKWRVGIPVT